MENFRHFRGTFLPKSCERARNRQSYLRKSFRKPDFTQRIYAFLLHLTGEYGIIAISVQYGGNLRRMLYILCLSVSANRSVLADGKEIILEKNGAGLFSLAFSRQPDPYRVGSPVAYHIPLFRKRLFRLAVHRLSGKRDLRVGRLVPAYPAWQTAWNLARRVQPFRGEQSVRAAHRGDHAAVSAMSDARVRCVYRIVRSVYGVRVPFADPHARRRDISGGFTGALFRAFYCGSVDPADYLQGNARGGAVYLLRGACRSVDPRLSPGAGDARR